MFNEFQKPLAIYNRCAIIYITVKRKTIAQTCGLKKKSS